MSPSIPPPGRGRGEQVDLPDHALQIELDPQYLLLGAPAIEGRARLYDVADVSGTQVVGWIKAQRDPSSLAELKNVTAGPTRRIPAARSDRRDAQNTAAEATVTTVHPRSSFAERSGPWRSRKALTCCLWTRTVSTAAVLDRIRLTHRFVRRIGNHTCRKLASAQQPRERGRIPTVRLHPVARLAGNVPPYTRGRGRRSADASHLR